MQITIKNDKLLREICGKLNKSPDTVVNELVESLDLLPDRIVRDAKKAALSDVLVHAFFDSLTGKEVNEAIYALLGSYEYYVYKVELDFADREFIFCMNFTPNESVLDMDEINLQISRHGFRMLVFRRLEGIKLDFDFIEIEG